MAKTGHKGSLIIFEAGLHKSVMKLCYDACMEEDFRILPPQGEEDTEGAHRVFEEFLTIYEPTLVKIEYYLEEVIEQVGPTYAEAYRPWHKALNDLFHGVYLTSRDRPLPDSESFIDALKMFSFDSAIRFLKDIGVSCRVHMQRDWSEQFHEHINLLLFSASILQQKEQEKEAEKVK
jgi:hypothetical protein